jgi:hypothetical protein
MKFLSGIITLRRFLREQDRPTPYNAAIRSLIYRTHQMVDGHQLPQYATSNRSQLSEVL